jgi:thiamine-monophosphate kinase
MHSSQSNSEFNLIERYFTDLTPARPDVPLGIGDDAALVSPPPGQQLAISVDTLVSGVHFLPSVSPQALGHKALAVNLSDLAAVGAEPAWATLALTLPDVEERWLQGFTEGFAHLASCYGVCLVGGDTTRGPLSLTVQVQGFVPGELALRRDGAQIGDDLYVTGCLGDAALFLRLLQSETAQQIDLESLRPSLERPEPRVEAGIALRGLATSAIDLSDGLLADLGHILEASGVGASIALQRLPLSPDFAGWLRTSGDWTPALAGGDDYELCFTAPPDCRPRIDGIAAQLGLRVSCIGRIEAVPGIRVLLPDGTAWTGSQKGYDHFASGAQDAG